MTWRLDVHEIERPILAWLDRLDADTEADGYVSDTDEVRKQIALLVAELAEARDVHTGDVDAYERRLDGTYQPRDEGKL